MMFSQSHLDQIRTGEKTQTRRLWSENYTARPSAGDIRMATPRSLGPIVSHDECDCYIRITRVSRERLGQMTEGDAFDEGGYTLAEFEALWADMHGEWEPARVVDVVEFEYVGQERPEHPGDGTGGEQAC